MMKKNQRFLVSGLALLLALLILPAAAFAQTNWPVFMQSESHNGVINDGASTSSSPTVNPIKLGTPGAFYGIDAASVLNNETYNGTSTTYAYTLADTSSGAAIFKTNVASPSTAAPGWTNNEIQLNQTSGFQLSAPVIDPNNDTLYAATLSGVDELSDTQFSQSGAGPWTVTTSGSSITYDNTSQGNYGYYATSADIATSGTSSTTTLTQTSASLTSTSDINLCFGAYGVSGVSGVTVTVLAEPAGGSTWTQIWSTSSNGWTSPKGTSWTSGQWNWVNGAVTGSPFTATGQYNIEYEIAVTGTSNSTLQFTNADLVSYQPGVSYITNIDDNGGAPTLNGIAIPNLVGQLNTPMLYDNGYVYVGTWPNSSTNIGSYYQINTSTNAVTSFTPTTAGEGFYWAGATVVTDTSGGRYLVFGSDKGYLYILNASTMAEVGSPIAISGGGDTAGKIRSSICYDSANSQIYFTDENDYLWCYSVTQNSSSISLAFNWVENIGYSTSTPALFNGYLYVGTGGVGTSGTVDCFGNLINGPTEEWSYSAAGPVQSSPIVYNNGSNTYVYYTTNNSTGQGYCLKDNGNGTCTLIWSSGSTDAYYALQGMTSEGGYLVFGNDKDYLTIVH
jgi:hypothetical protein